MNEATSLPLAPGAGDLWAAAEAVTFGAADVFVVTKDSGVPDALDTIARIRAALPDTPLVVGGRVGPVTIAATRAAADGAIIGGALKKDSGHFTRVDASPAREFTA